MQSAVELSATLEDYLVTAARLIDEKGSARVRDMAAALAVHKSSVTAALKALADKGLVNYAPYELATLTKQGEARARRIAQRHEVLRSFLTEVLAVDAGMAETNARLMEHGLDREVLERIRLFAAFVACCPHCGEERLQAFRDYYDRESARQDSPSAAPEEPR